MTDWENEARKWAAEAQQLSREHAEMADKLGYAKWLADVASCDAMRLRAEVLACRQLVGAEEVEPLSAAFERRIGQLERRISDLQAEMAERCDGCGA